MSIIHDLKLKILDTESEIAIVDNKYKERSYLMSQSILVNINRLNKQYNELSKDAMISSKLS